VFFGNRFAVSISPLPLCPICQNSHIMPQPFFQRCVRLHQKVMFPCIDLSRHNFSPFSNER
jgi:hypothetical protein